MPSFKMKHLIQKIKLPKVLRIYTSVSPSSFWKVELIILSLKTCINSSIFFIAYSLHWCKESKIDFKKSKKQSCCISGEVNWASSELKYCAMSSASSYVTVAFWSIPKWPTKHSSQKNFRDAERCNNFSPILLIS